MFDCFNEGVRYLKDKLGVRESNKDLYKNESIIPYSDEHLIHVLLGQYYYGIEAKKELYNKLVSLGVKL